MANTPKKGVRVLSKRNKNKSELLIKSTDALFKYSVDMLICMVPLAIISMYLYGIAVLWRILTSVVTAVLCEYIAFRIMKKDKTINDLSAVTTGLALALMLPASCPMYFALAGSAFAILVAKVPFGSARKTPFIPAAAGFAFLCVCFSKELFTYPLSNAATSSLNTNSATNIGISFGEMLTYGKSISLTPLEIISILTGKSPGPLGTTCMLAMIGIAIYLLAKRPKRFVITLAFLLATSFMALAFPRVNSGRITSLIMELSAGSLVFVSLILLPDPATSPKKFPQTFFYGFFAGIICMLLRYYGKYTECDCFAVLIMNAVFPVCETWSAIIKNYIKEKKKFKNAVKKDKELAKLIKEEQEDFSDLNAETENPEDYENTFLGSDEPKSLNSNTENTDGGKDDE